MRSVLILLFFVVATTTGMAQLAKADRLFQKKDFFGASELYQELFEKERSKYSLERLADCYYNTLQYDKGLEITTKLVKGDFNDGDKKLDSRYLFIHSQFLLVKGNYTEAGNQFKAYHNAIGTSQDWIANQLSAFEALQGQQGKFSLETVTFNTDDAAEFGAIERDGAIFFVSDRKAGNSSKTYSWTNRPFLDIYKLPVDSEGVATGTPEPLSDDINTVFHEGSFCFSKDGKTLFFTQSELASSKSIDKDIKENKVKLFKSVKGSDGEWSTPEKLSFCSDAANYEHPSLSHDGKKLYFASDREGGLGNFDIYVVPMSSDGSFGAISNLGPTINTAQREQFPYITEKGHLLFASDGHLGMGFLDIWASKNSDGQFQSPFNLGVPVNSAYDDFSFSYSKQKIGYFSSSRNGPSDDIFRFRQLEELFSEEILANVSVVDSETGESVDNVKVDLINAEGRIVYDKNLSSPSSFATLLEEGDYKLNVVAPKYVPELFDLVIVADRDNYTVQITKSDNIEDVVRGVENTSLDVITKLVKDDTPPKIYAKQGKLYFEMPPIYFRFDKWKLTDESKQLLDKLAVKLKENPSLKIAINSHTDSRGPDAYNLRLSEKRAKSTKDYLVSSGVSTNRIDTRAFGESKPMVSCGDNCDEFQHYKNRRSEFEITDY